MFLRIGNWSGRWWDPEGRGGIPSGTGPQWRGSDETHESKVYHRWAFSCGGTTPGMARWCSIPGRRCHRDWPAGQSSRRPAGRAVCRPSRRGSGRPEGEHLAVFPDQPVAVAARCRVNADHGLVERRIGHRAVEGGPKLNTSPSAAASQWPSPTTRYAHMPWAGWSGLSNYNLLATSARVRAFGSRFLTNQNTGERNQGARLGIMEV